MLSFTLGCPMNSASRCGRSDNSTTDSSLRISGVVISARVIAFECIPKIARKPVMSDLRRNRRQSFRRSFQRLRLLAESKACDRLTHCRLVVEARSRHSRHSHFLREPEGELQSAKITQLGEIGEDV